MKQSPLDVNDRVNPRTNLKAHVSGEVIARRRYAPRNRGGCATCRNRHVRCDQQRPRCASCQKSSRQCIYSNQGDQSCQDQENLRLVLWEPSESIRIQNQISLIPGQTPAEARALDYFREIVAPNLAGTYDPTFWNRVVVQVSHNVSSLRHAIVALASHWEKVVEPGGRKRNTHNMECDPYALQQYSKAVTGMRKTLQNDPRPSREELLVSSVLFFCIEMYQNHLDSALRQLSCGIQLFCDWSNDTYPKAHSDPFSGHDEFARLTSHIFRRLLVQCMLFPMRSIAQEEPVFLPHYAPITPEMPANFRSSDEARDYYNFCISALCYHAKKSATALTPEQLSVESHMEQYQPFMAAVAYFKQWQQAFKTFQRTSKALMDSTTGEIRDRRCIVMDMHNFALQIMIPSFSFKTEMEYDDYTHLFENIIDNASYLLTTSTNTTTTSPPRKNSSRNSSSSPHHYPKFDIGLIPPMFLTALRCRDPVIRRKAIALLGQGPRQEGVWNSAMVASIARRVLAIEEDGAADLSLSLATTTTASPPKESCRDIPISSRVKIIDATIHTSTRQVAVVMERQVETVTERYQVRLIYEMISY